MVPHGPLPSGVATWHISAFNLQQHADLTQKMQYPSGFKTI
jgi:hypothetical protein